MLLKSNVLTCFTVKIPFIVVNIHIVACLHVFETVDKTNLSTYHFSTLVITVADCVFDVQLSADVESFNRDKGKKHYHSPFV